MKENLEDLLQSSEDKYLHPASDFFFVATEATQGK